MKVLKNIVRVSLSQEDSKIVNYLIRKGMYMSKSEFIRDLIRRRIEREETLAFQRKRVELRAD